MLNSRDLVLIYLALLTLNIREANSKCEAVRVGEEICEQQMRLAATQPAVQESGWWLTAKAPLIREVERSGHRDDSDRLKCKQ